MRLQWRCVLVVAVLMAGSLLLAACGGEEGVIEPFPDMTPPAEGTGGIRGHMHGGPSEVLLCGEDWQEFVPDLGEPEFAVRGVGCWGGEMLRASIDSSRNDLFFFDGLEPGDYWLIGTGGLGASQRWYMIGEHGHKVRVKEGQWTDVASFEVEGD